MNKHLEAAEKVWREDFNREQNKIRDNELKQYFINKYCADKEWRDCLEWLEATEESRTAEASGLDEIWRRRCAASAAWYSAINNYEVKYEGRKLNR